MKKTVLITCPKCKVAYYIESNGEKEKKIKCPYCGQESTVQIDLSDKHEDHRLSEQKTPSNHEQREN